jgi:hypothetical protein
MTTRFIDNLMTVTLKGFECDVLKQLKNDDADLDDMHQLLYKVRDGTIKKFERLERGLYNVYYTTS